MMSAHDVDDDNSAVESHPTAQDGEIALET